MSVFYKKPINISYEYIENYVNSKDIIKNNNLLFKYLYILSKKYALDNKFNFNNKDDLELFSIKCASEIFDHVDEDTFLFEDKFNEISTNLLTKYKNSSFLLDDDNKEFLFKNYILDRMQYYTLTGYGDITNFTDYINKFVFKLPKKKNSSELSDIYISILYSFYYTIVKYSTTIFNFDTRIIPKVILYNIQDTYYNYIYSIVVELVCILRDSFNKTISTKFDNIWSIKLKDFINNENS